LKEVQKKILLAGMVAVFAFLVTIGSTYAWFTIVNENSVEAVSVNVQAQQSLLIMMDDDEAHGGNGLNLVDDETYLNNPANYVTNLTNAIISAEYDFESIVLEPVTTLNGRAMTWRDTSTIGIANKYVEFKVWVLSQTDTVNVAVENLTLTANNTPASKDNVKQAARLSFDDAVGNPVIFGLDKDFGFNDGTGLPSETATAIAAYHGIYYTTEVGGAVAGESTEALGSASTAFSLTAGQPKRITIRIWIEGWDEECTNNLSAAIFGMGFSLTVKP
jgi:hypothetical protein